jgi:hypothetical protein
MSIKELLKPTRSKIALFIILGFVLSLIPVPSPVRGFGEVSWFKPAGLPLGYIPSGVQCMLSGPDDSCPQPEFLWLNFIIDLIIWYVLSAVIIFCHGEVRKK